MRELLRLFGQQGKRIAVLQLLEQAVAVPLFTQQKRLLLANGIKGLVFDPFGPVLDVTYATKS